MNMGYQKLKGKLFLVKLKYQMHDFMINYKKML